MMAAFKIPNPHTLFHLVPAGDDPLARQALDHPDNKRFVSTSSTGENGLEIGFHVPRMAGGHVITRLGRDGDIVLDKAGARRHAAFEMHPETRLVLLIASSKDWTSVTGLPIIEANPTVKEEAVPKVKHKTDPTTKEEAIPGSFVVLYGQDHTITISSYMFHLIWRRLDQDEEENTTKLEHIARQDFDDSMERLAEIPSRFHSEILTPAEQSHHLTRFHSSRKTKYRELTQNRMEIGHGSFGTVYKSVDRTTGALFAVKVVDLTKAPGDKSKNKANLWREIKLQEEFEHKHTLQLLGTDHWDTDAPSLFMPLMDGSVQGLLDRPPPGTNFRDVAGDVLHQMLQALDYLATRKDPKTGGPRPVFHRDLKPANILFLTKVTGEGQSENVYQLADFGLASDESLAGTLCGTRAYAPPELGFMHGQFPQTSKIDVWSLYVTIIHILPDQDFPPTPCTQTAVFEAIQKSRSSNQVEFLEAMARIHPDQRASAAQMLVKVFDGKGLITPRDEVPEIEAAPVHPATGISGLSRRTSQGPAKFDHRVPAAPGVNSARNRLIKYPEILDRRKGVPDTKPKRLGPRGPIPARGPPNPGPERHVADKRPADRKEKRMNVALQIAQPGPSKTVAPFTAAAVGTKGKGTRKGKEKEEIVPTTAQWGKTIPGAWLDQ